MIADTLTAVAIYTVTAALLAVAFHYW